MNTEIEQVETEIEAKKADIGEKLERLEDRAVAAARKGKQAVSLKHQINQRPWVVLAGAVGIGVLLGRKQPQMQAMLVDMKSLKAKKGKKSNGADGSRHPLMERGQALLTSAVLPGLVTALARRYAPEVMRRE